MAIALSPKNIAGNTRLQQPATQQAVVGNAVDPELPPTVIFDNSEPGKATAWAVILTALDVEHLAVQAHLAAVETKLPEVIHRGTVYTYGLFKAPGCNWNIAVAQIGAGNAGASSEAERAIERFQPKVILFVGVAGGIKDVDIGDVVAATKIYSYDRGKVLSDQTLPRPELGHASYELEQRAMAEARKEDWRSRIRSETQADLLPSNPKVKVAPIAAGEKVIATRKAGIYEYLREYYDDAIAVEMEGFGFLEAVRRRDEKVSTIVIRGISDLLEGKADFDAKGSQTLAACHASAFAFELLAKLDGEPPPESVGEFVGAAQIQFDGTLPEGLVSLCVEELAGEDEFYLHAHLEKQEFVKRGIVYPRLTELYDLIDMSQEPEAIISALINCNGEMQEQRECIIRQFFVWMQKQRTLSPDAVTCLLINNQTEFEIPWELLELDGHPLGAVMQIVRCRTVEPETTPVQSCCEGQVLMYAKPEYSELQAFQRCHLSDFQQFLNNLQQPKADFGLVFIDGSSFSEPLTSIPSVRLKYSRLFKTRSSVVFVGGQLCLNGTERLKYRKFLTTFLAHGAKGVVGTLKAIEDNKAARVVSSFFTDLCLERKDDDPKYTIPELLHRLRKQAADRLENEVLTDENGWFYLATFMHVYYGNPMTMLKLLSVEGLSSG